MVRLSTILASIILLNVATTHLARAQASLPSLPLKAQCAFIGSFEQSKRLEGLIDPLVSNGDFYFHCEHGVIWKSVEPVAESLVFRKNDSAFAFNQQNEPREIKSPQGKVLGRLLNDLIGADFQQLAKTFELEQLDQNTVRFTPRKRRLKRAIKTVDLTVIESDRKTIEDDEKKSVKIDIVDRNNQLTSVTAVQTQVVEAHLDKGALQTQCAENNQFLRRECTLLIGTKQ